MEEPVRRYVMHIARTSLQGGIPNDKYPVEYLYDYRLTNHFWTLYATDWQGFVRTTGDTKFHDAVNNSTKAEGKRISKKDGVCFKPSCDTGSGRQTNQGNIQACFEINSYYYLYHVAEHDDEKIVVYIYWIPISYIKKWYTQYGGKNGTISYSNIMKCLACAVDEPSIVRRGFPTVVSQTQGTRG